MAEPTRDIAIYAPFAAYFFEGAEGATGSLTGRSGGGAELQMVLLARRLAAMGLGVALITYPVRGGLSTPPAGPQVVERAAHASNRPPFGKLSEAGRIWRAMAAADAGVYLFRGSGPQVFVGSTFCRLHRRRLVFSAANDLDFDFARPDRGRLQLRLFRAALGRADLVVVQREEQLELARAAGIERPELIRSFAEPAEPSPEEPEGFLWIARLVGYKNPLTYVQLAESLPDVPFRMVTYATAETSEELEQEVRRRAARVENLELIGESPRSKLLDLIARSTAVVSTSAAEGMPNTFLEAWSRGVPVISLDYDPDGKIEQLGLGLFAHGSERELEEAAASLWRDRPRRDELGRAGRDYVHREHSPDAVAGRWAEVLRGVGVGAAGRPA